MPVDVSARIVAHDYGFADWKPDRQVTISKTFYLYVVPAQVGGRWRLEAELPSGRRDWIAPSRRGMAAWDAADSEGGKGSPRSGPQSPERPPDGTRPR